MLHQESGEVLEAVDSLRAKVVAHARDHIGDGPKGSDAVLRYWQTCGAVNGATPYNDFQLRQAAGCIRNQRGNDHCGVFCLCVLHECGLSKEPWPQGSTFLHKDWITQDPQPGDILYQPAPFGHHGIVESRYEKNGEIWLKSIEANTPTTIGRDRKEPKNVVYYSIKPLLLKALDAA